MNKYLKNPELPAPIKLAHISVTTTENYEKMVEFYSELLNMRTILDMDNVAVKMTLLGFDDEHHRIGILKLPQGERPAPGTTGMEHSSWSFGALDNLIAAVKSFDQRFGIWPAMVFHQGPIIALSYRDPDGNRVEVIADLLESQDEVVAYMQEKGSDPKFNSLLRFDLRKFIELREGDTPVEDLEKYETVLRLVEEGTLAPSV